MTNTNFSLIKNILDSNGNDQLIKGSLVVDEASGKTFEDLVTETPLAISTAINTAIKALKGGVAVEYDTLKKLSAVLETTKASVDTFFSQGTDATPEAIDTLKELLAEITTNKTTVDALLNDKLDKANIVNDLSTGGVDTVLAAEQGKIIKGLIDNLHTFTNEHILDGISKNATSGNLLFNDKELTGETGLSFVASADAVPIYNGKVRFVVESYTKPAESTL